MSPEAAQLQKPQDYKETFKNRKVVSEYADPCSLAAKESFKCLDRNDYDRDACLDYFRAYRECKATWMKQRREDRRAGRVSV